MENILVIGNGFDIAHGLNTSYENFIDFCNVVKDVYANFTLETGNPLDYLNNLKIELNKIFKERSVSQKAVNFFINLTSETDNYHFIDLCKNNYWLEHVKVHKANMGDKWSDFEYIIAKQIEGLAYIANHLDWNTSPSDLIKLNNEIYKLYGLLKQKADNNIDFSNAIEVLKKYLYQELNNLTWLLEIYLTRFLNTKTKTLELFEILPVTKLISFNYTDTYQKIYKKFSKLKEEDIHYIHGIAQKNRAKQLNNMVFGIGDEIKNTTLDDEYNYVEFQKYYQRIIKKTGVTYSKWLKRNEILLIFIYGHSLDRVDGDIIRDLIYGDKSRIIIFYYNQEALNVLVTNLVKILKKDNLIRFTNEEKILFLKSDDVTSIKKLLNIETETLKERKKIKFKV